MFPVLAAASNGPLFLLVTSPEGTGAKPNIYLLGKSLLVNACILIETDKTVGQGWGVQKEGIETCWRSPHCRGQH